MEYLENDSGKNSLAGFSYQIKVFAYYAFKLKNGEQVEFESIDDVSIKKSDINNENLDNPDNNFVCKAPNIAIQVKRTKVSRDAKLKMIYNWILLESSGYNIEQYILFTPKSYQNNEDIFYIDGEELYSGIIRSDKKKSALVSQVKELYRNRKEEFINTYISIKDKFRFKDVDNIDDEIDELASEPFAKIINEVIHKQRLEQFLQRVTAEIFKKIAKKESYILTHKQFMGSIENIRLNHSEGVTLPIYADFKKINKIDLSDMKIARSREFIQLSFCNLDDRLIKNNLLYGMYYNDAISKYLELNKISDIESIETATFENYLDELDKLDFENNDTPRNRLLGTQKRPNDYADNEQIKKGSAIHLTKENIGENMISWRDDNE